MADFLNVKILSPTQTIFDGPALSVSSTNTLGKFDILPYHANFITLIEKTPLILRVRKAGTENVPFTTKAFKEFFDTDVTEIKYDFDTAIIFTKDNNVKIYTNIQANFD